MVTTKKLIYIGLLMSIISKILFEIFLVKGFGRSYFHCSVFVENFSCSFLEWLINPGDIVVMLPTFIAVLFIGFMIDIFKIEKNSRNNKQITKFK